MTVTRNIENEGSPQRRYFRDMYITISSSNCITEYPLYMTANAGEYGVIYHSNDEMNCVESYEMSSGPSQAFPSITLSLKMKRLKTYYPFLVDDIKPGRNIIKVNAVGRDVFIVAKIKAGSDVLTIVGYSPYEVLKSVAFPISTSYTFTRTIAVAGTGEKTITDNSSWTTGVCMTPFHLLKYCLNSNLSMISGISLEIKDTDILISPSLVAQCIGVFSDGDQDYPGRYAWVNRTLMDSDPYFNESITPTPGNTKTGTCSIIFDSSLSVWQVISICAAAMGAKVYFSYNRAYVIDPTCRYAPLPLDKLNITSNSNVWVPPIDEGYIWTGEPGKYLSMNMYQPVMPTEEESDFAAHVLNIPTLGDEGSETIYNEICITSNICNSDGTPTTETCTTSMSADLNGVVDKFDDLRKNNANYLAYKDYKVYPELYGDGSLVSIERQGSRDFFGVVSKTIELPCVCYWTGDTKEQVQRNNRGCNPIARQIAARMNMRLADAEQSIGFNMAETERDSDGDMYWQPYYWMKHTTTDDSQTPPVKSYYDIGPMARVKSLTDLINEVRITNKQNFGDYRELPGKLALTKIIRKFPGLYTEYWFGIIEPCNLSAELSKIIYKSV